MVTNKDWVQDFKDWSHLFFIFMNPGVQKSSNMKKTKTIEIILLQPCLTSLVHEGLFKELILYSVFLNPENIFSIYSREVTKQLPAGFFVIE